MTSDCDATRVHGCQMAVITCRMQTRSTSQSGTASSCSEYHSESFLNQMSSCSSMTGMKLHGCSKGSVLVEQKGSHLEQESLPFLLAPTAPLTPQPSALQKGPSLSPQRLC